MSRMKILMTGSSCGRARRPSRAFGRRPQLGRERRPRQRWVLGAFSVIALLGRLLRIISGVCIEKSLQRAGGNPAGTSA